MKRCLVAGAAAAVLLGNADAFAPSAGAGLSRTCLTDQRAACTGAPALRMGLGDIFGKAFENNPNIPKQPVTGPGSAGFSPQKAVPVEAPVAPPPAPAAQVWQEVADPATGNPYWWNTETGETSWSPPAAAAPPPVPVPPPMPTPPVKNLATSVVPPGAAVAQAQEEQDEDLGPTGPSLERQLINLNKFLVNGIIDQEEYDRQKAEIKAQMPDGPVFDPNTLQRPFKTTTMRWGALVDAKIPQGWTEGKDYDRLTKLEAGSLVGINRSDGSIRFGQVVQKGGLLWEDRWKVVVSMKPDGTPGATREEDAVMLLRPTKSGLAPVLEAMPDITVNEKDIDLTTGEKSKGMFGGMFAEPVYEGGTATNLQPIAPPSGAVPKAVVPQGIIPGGVPTAVPPAAVPKAVVPPGVPQPGQAPPAVPPPQAAPAPEDASKTSGWI